MSGESKIDWALLPLGEIPDAEVAKAIGLSPITVRQRRCSMGIASCRAVGRPTTSGKAIEWERVTLGQLPDVVAAEILGCSKGTVTSKRSRMGIPSVDGSRFWLSTALLKHLNQIGQPESGESVGKLLGVATEAATRALQRLHARGLVKRVAYALYTSLSSDLAEFDDIDWDAQPLGEMSDRYLAKQLGVSKSAVCRQRLKRGISGCRKQRHEGKTA